MLFLTILGQTFPAAIGLGGTVSAPKKAQRSDQINWVEKHEFVAFTCALSQNAKSSSRTWNLTA